MSSVRSLHVITSDARRGAETFAVNLVDELRRSGSDAYVVALSPSGSPNPLEVDCLGPSRRSVTTLRGLRRMARAADIVVAHGSSTLEACAVGLSGTGTPFVYRTIGDPQYWVTSRYRERIVRSFLARASGHVVLWEGAARQLKTRYGVAAERISVIPNAVRSDLFLKATGKERAEARGRFGLAIGHPCLAYVGALSPEKDVRTAIDACVAVSDSVLLVAGEGSEGRDLRDYARHVAARVDFLGSIADPRDVYAAADLLLLPSLTEGMPAVLLEAGLVGTPTLATAVGAIPEVIESGETGFIVPERSPQEFVGAVESSLANAGRVGENAARRFGFAYSIEATASEWNRLLDGAVVPFSD